MQLTRRNVVFFLLPNFSMRALSSALEALKLANEIAGNELYSWRMISGDGQAVESNCGFLFAVDAALRAERLNLNRVAGPDMVVVCGGYTVPANIAPAIGSWLLACRGRRAILVALGSGAFVVARAGLADDRRCAVHWQLFPGFSEEFSHVRAAQTTFEIDDDFYSCPGGDAPFDMFLHLIQHQCGSAVAELVGEKAFRSRPSEPSERQRLPAQPWHSALIKVIDDMEGNVSEPLALESIANRARLSCRQMQRLFKQQIGVSPARYYRTMRLERAHLLLLTSAMSVVEVALACGFLSASHFGKVYRQAYGCAPIRTRIAAVKSNRPRTARYQASYAKSS